MGLSVFPAASTSTQKTLGLSVLSTNASLTTLPTNKSITAVIIGGGGGAAYVSSAGPIGAGGSGGGGSGQVKEVTFVLTSSVTVSCTIGAGGAGVSFNANGGNGGSTILSIPNIVSVTALGGVGSHTAYGGGSGGGAGGGGGGGGTGNGSNGINGALLGQRILELASTQYATYPGASQKIDENFWTFPVSSVTNASSSIYTPNWAPYAFNLIPGVYLQGTNDYNSGSAGGVALPPVSVSTAAGAVANNQIILSSNWTGSSTSFPQVGYATQDGYSVLPTTIDLLTRANIRIPGGGGGGGGGNYNSGTARTGGSGAGTGGAGGSGGYSDTVNNNIRATQGTAGAQPGGGAGGTGGFAYNSLSGPTAGSTASGGNGAIYFFWAAQEEI